ncbi:MAG: DUF192 domain-containing protein [Burkholderiaceae bacterium]|nr:DUF192 domain-containing protein [Burkholderiaceae bacterium]
MSSIASWVRRALLALIASIGAAGAWPQDQPQNLAATTLKVGMHSIRAQLAITPMQRQIGLMHRREMPSHEGMLFVFDEPSQQCFWMRNTLIPLTIAFLADDGTVVNLADMKPQSDDSHCSAKPVRYALEMNQGWFAKRGIKPGTRISGEVFSR